MVRSNAFLFHNSGLIDLLEDRCRQQMDVLAQNGQIGAIGRDLTPPEGCTVIDCEGKYLMPSLIDSHTHIMFADTLPIFLADGVTTVINMCGHACHLRWQKELLAGTREGSDLITTGPIIDGTEKYHLSFQLCREEPISADASYPGLLAFPGIIAAPDAETARKAVRYTKEAGYAYVKGYNHMEREAHDALFDEAAKLGLQVLGHYDDCINSDCLTDLNPEDYEIRQRTVSHVIFVNEQNLPKMLEAGVYLDPTVIVERVHFGGERETAAYQEELSILNPAIQKSWTDSNDLHRASYQGDHIKYRVKRRGFEWYEHVISTYHRSGGKIIAGTDGGMEYMLPGWSLHQELAGYVKAGLTPYEALRTATVNPVACFDLKDEAGTIEKGRPSRLLLLDANPLEDIYALSQVSAVLKDNRFYDRAGLDTWRQQLHDLPADQLESV